MALRAGRDRRALRCGARQVACRAPELPLSGRVRARRCREALAERFEVVTKPGQSGLVSFRPAGDPEETVARLYARDVVVRAIPGKDLIRVSCGYWTSEEDVERLLAGLAS